MMFDVDVGQHPAQFPIESIDSLELFCAEEELNKPRFELIDITPLSVSTATDSLTEQLHYTDLFDHETQEAVSPWGHSIATTSSSGSPSHLYSNRVLNILNEEHDKVAETSEVDHLTRNFVLTQASNILGILRFELRLLKFFDEACVPLFSYEVNDGIHNAWKYKVPPLFLESDLVRRSMFSFAAMGLSATMDLNLLQLGDNYEYGEDQARLLQAESTLQQNSHPNKFPRWIQDIGSNIEVYDFDTDCKLNMFLLTTKYFLDALSKSQEKIGQAASQKYGFEDPFIAKELTVSSILIFSFLGIQPNRLIKLINFETNGKCKSNSKDNFECESEPNNDPQVEPRDNPEDEPEPDMIKVSIGVRETIISCSSTVLQTDLCGLLFFRASFEVGCPSLKECRYPVIRDLVMHLYEFDEVSEFGTLDELNESRNVDEFDSETALELEALKGAITSLMLGMYGTLYHKFPIPLFRFLMVIKDDFQSLLYNKHPYALRILFVYSCLNSFARFQMYNDHNMWRDYILWYKEEVQKQGWRWYDMDECLYYLVVEKYYLMIQYTDFPQIDPIKICAEEDNQMAVDI